MVDSGTPYVKPTRRGIPPHLTPYLVSAATLVAMVVIYLRFTTFKELLNQPDPRVKLMNRLIDDAAGVFNIWEAQDTGLVKLAGMEVAITPAPGLRDCTTIPQRALRYRLSGTWTDTSIWQQGYLLLSPWDPGEVLGQPFFYRGAFVHAPAPAGLVHLEGCEFVFRQSDRGISGTTQEDFCSLPFEGEGYQRLKITVTEQRIRLDYARYPMGDSTAGESYTWVLLPRSNN